MIKPLVGIWIFLLAALAHSQVLTVTAHRASVYDAPSDSAKALFQAKKGQRFKAAGEPKQDFYRLRTKSGKVVWISRDDVKASAADVKPAAGAAKPKPEAKEDKPEAEEAATPEAPFKRWSIDVGASSNFSSGTSAYEVYLGVNYSILRWLVLRNAPFYRSQSGASAVFGLDTSLQGRHGIGLGAGVELLGMLGAGYRIANRGASAPIVEAGLGVRKDAFQVNVSVKEVLHSVVSSTISNEMLFSLSVSGGMSF